MHEFEFYMAIVYDAFSDSLYAGFIVSTPWPLAVNGFKVQFQLVEE